MSDYPGMKQPYIKLPSLSKIHMHFPISMQSQSTEFDLNILDSGIYIVVLSIKNGALNQTNVLD